MMIAQVERPCPETNVPQPEIRYVHYPRPSTYKRYHMIPATDWNYEFCGFIFYGSFVYSAEKNADARRLDSLQFCQRKGLEVGGLRLC